MDLCAVCWSLNQRIRIPLCEEVSHERHVQETRRETPHANRTSRRDHCRTGIASGGETDRLGRYGLRRRQHSRGVRKAQGHVDYTSQPGASLGRRWRDRKIRCWRSSKPQQFVAMSSCTRAKASWCLTAACPRTGSGPKQKSARSTCVETPRSTLSWRGVARRFDDRKTTTWQIAARTPSS